MRTYVMDFETSDFRPDIGTLLVACFGEITSTGVMRKMYTQTIDTIGKGTVAQREKMLAEWAAAKWQEADILIGQNHKAFDQKFLQGVMLRHGIQNGILEPRILIDTLQIGKGSFGMSMSMANIADVLGLGKKDAPEKGNWREANHGDPASLERIKDRCEADVRMTNLIWQKFKPLYFRKFGK